MQPYRHIHLVIITVTERDTANHDAAHGVDDIAQLYIGHDATHGDLIVQAKGITIDIDAVDGLDPRRRRVLPYPEAVVDEAVVHPKDRVAGAGGDVGHHATNAVVTIGVGAAMLLSTCVASLRGRVQLTRLRCSLPCCCSLFASYTCRHSSGCTARSTAHRWRVRGSEACCSARDRCGK